MIPQGGDDCKRLLGGVLNWPKNQWLRSAPAVVPPAPAHCAHEHNANDAYRPDLTIAASKAAREFPRCAANTSESPPLEPGDAIRVKAAEVWLRLGWAGLASRELEGGVANLPSPLDTAGADAGVVGVDLGVSAYSWLLMPITLAKIVGLETCRFA